MQKDLQNYYKNVADISKDQLISLREFIRSLLPESEEIISYGIPTFVMDGKSIVGIGGWNNFVSLYPFGNEPIKKLAEELKDLKTSKGAIQLPLNKPLPKSLIKKVIELKIKSS